MKCEIVKDFTDKHDNTIKYKAGDVVEFTTDRVKEIRSKEKEIDEKLIKQVKQKRVVE